MSRLGALRVLETFAGTRIRQPILLIYACRQSVPIRTLGGMMDGVLAFVVTIGAMLASIWAI